MQLPYFLPPVTATDDQVHPVQEVELPQVTTTFRIVSQESLNCRGFSQNSFWKVKYSNSARDETWRRGSKLSYIISRTGNGASADNVLDGQTRDRNTTCSGSLSSVSIRLWNYGRSRSACHLKEESKSSFEGLGLNNPVLKIDENTKIELTYMEVTTIVVLFDQNAILGDRWHGDTIVSDALDCPGGTCNGFNPDGCISALARCCRDHERRMYYPGQTL